MRPLCLLIALLLAVSAAAFERPSENERMRALGNRYELPEAVRPLFDPDADFAPVPRPGPNDWLTWHDEPGQTLEEYRESGANRPDATRHILYLLPLGDFPEETAPDLELVRRYASAFYQMEVRLLKAYHPHDLEFTPRKGRPMGPRA